MYPILGEGGVNSLQDDWIYCPWLSYNTQNDVGTVQSSRAYRYASMPARLFAPRRSLALKSSLKKGLCF